MQAVKPVVAKIVVNPRLKMLRVKFSYDMHNTLALSNTALTSSDICDIKHEHASELVERVIRKHAAELRANFVLVQGCPAARHLTVPVQITVDQ